MTALIIILVLVTAYAIYETCLTTHCIRARKRAEKEVSSAEERAIRASELEQRYRDELKIANTDKWEETATFFIKPNRSAYIKVATAARKSGNTEKSYKILEQMKYVRSHCSDAYEHLEFLDMLINEITNILEGNESA